VPGKIYKLCLFKKFKTQEIIFFRLMFVSVMTTVWQDCKFSVGEAAIKCNSLFNIKDETPIGIQDKGRAGYRMVIHLLDQRNLCRKPRL